MRLSNKVLLASTNRHKWEEFSKLFLTAYPELELVPAKELVRNPEKLQLVEQYPSYLENATAKARLGQQCTHYPVLADDSGLEVTALEGKPGVHSHRYAPLKTGLSQDQANLQLVLDEIKNQSDRSAKFVCSLVLVIEGILLKSTGTLMGTLAETPRGKDGFGYDSIFIPSGSQKTLAEMTMAEKNEISHRFKAVGELVQQMKMHGIVLAKP